MSRRRVSLSLVLAPPLLLGLGAVVAGQAMRVQLGVQPDGSILAPTNQTLTPIGTVRRLEGARPKDMALSPDGKTLAVLTTGKALFFTTAGEPAGEVSVSGGALGIAWAPDGHTLYLSGANGRIHRLAEESGRWRPAGDFPVAVPAAPASNGARQPANPQPNGLAVSPDGRRLYAALGIRNAVAVLDLPEMKPASVAPVGVAPYNVALSGDGKLLVVANRGGTRAGPEEVTVSPSAGTEVRVDPWTDAALNGSLSFIDTATLAVTEVQAGRQPAGMAFSPDGTTLYVANSDGDTLSVVDVARKAIRDTVSLRPADDPGFGQIPTDVAVSRDGKQVYVTCGGGNAAAVLAVGRKGSRVSAYLPTGWYPIAVRQREGTLFVASAKGIGSRPQGNAGRFAVHQSVGMLQVIPPVPNREYARYSRMVAANNHWGHEQPARKDVAPVPIPERVGEPSLFKYVVYIIRENHTYDLNHGDMPEGNGDRSLCLFPEEVTPNGHALARQWVLLDNTYTSGTNSADGHQWTDSAIANGYVEQNYAAHSRSYPYDGGDPLAYSPQGFLWTAARAKGLSVRVYGEFVNRPKIVDPATGKGGAWKELWEDYKSGGKRFKITAETDNAALRPLLHPHVIGFPLTVSDQWRADQFLDELKEFEANGKMPALSILLLPNDHTSGARPGMPTPRAQVADNDLALGRIIESLSRSTFWKETLILVIEDDSQLGFDHVDGHRTVAYCVSPYTRRGIVSSEPFNHTSFLRTMELVLGIPAMSRFDRTATPLRSLFTTTADLRPYTHLRARIPLDEMNPPAAALRGEARKLAEACRELDWSDVDRADPLIVARSVWQAQRPGVPFPRAKFHAVEEAEQRGQGRD